MFKFVVLFICILQSLYANASTEVDTSKALISVHNEPSTICNELHPEKAYLTVDWYPAEPYQFSHINRNGRYAVTGLDIALIEALAARVGVGITYVDSVWEKAISDIQSGKSDLVAGAINTKERNVFAMFSLPYRFEEVSLFTLESGRKKLTFSNINEFLVQVRLFNFRLGIIEKSVYGDMEITEYLNKESNKDIISSQYANEIEMLQALTMGEIDGYLADRVVGTALAFNNPHRKEIRETKLGLKTPVHLMFSRKTMSADMVDKFNGAIKEFVNSAAYREIIKGYIYQVLLLKAVDSKWYYIIGLVGSIAFAISGIAIAVRTNATLFGTFILALLPSALGCLLLDVIINGRADIDFTLTPSYAYYISVIVLIGFFVVKLLNHYNMQLYEDDSTKRIWSNILVVCDSLGQASFIIVGVVIAVVEKVEPLEFWGPCFGFVTSSTGVFLRELLCNYNAKSDLIHGKVNFEISILWGVIFSILLNLNYHHDESTIIYSIIAVIAGAFITRLLTYYYNVGNITFHKDREEPYAQK